MKQNPYSNCSCIGHFCAPGCDCGFSNDFHRFEVYRITQYQSDCFDHGFMFSDNYHPAADLRYAD